MPNSVRSLLVPVVALATLASLLSACSSSGGAGRSAAPSTADRSSGSGATTSADPASALFTGLRTAAASVTSAHVKVDVQTQGTELIGEGDAKFAAGKVVAFDLNVHIRVHAGATSAQDQRAQVRLVRAGVEYVKQSGRGWQRVTARTATAGGETGQIAFAEYASAVVLAGVAEPAYSRDLRAASGDVRRRLATTVAGVPATPWAFDVDVSKVTGEAAGLAKLAGSVTTVLTDLSTDRSGRVVQLDQDGRADGAASADSVVAIRATVTRYGEPVTVTAPQ